MNATTAFSLGRTASQDGLGESGRYAVPAKYRADWYGGWLTSQRELAAPRAAARLAANKVSIALLNECIRDITGAILRS